MTKFNSLYKENHNCWKKSAASKAAVIIDYADYYATIYHAIDNAKHSVFIIGWDINSSIQLIRDVNGTGGKYIKDKTRTLYSLICRKARENPEMQFYLNCWQFPLAFASDRESMSWFKWKFFSPKNVHFCVDNDTPFYGCHHQKVVVIDDEIAFCGGMDIASKRWDTRHHHATTPKRIDPAGVFDFFQKQFYRPYHDIMVMYKGDVVMHFAQLARDRWAKTMVIDAIPIRQDQDIEKKWPDYIEADFKNVDVVISRTLPATPEYDVVDEILKAYLDEIKQAEHFIYIENQFLSCKEIAYALNEQLKKKPDLRLLMVTSNEPRGLLGKQAVIAGRHNFHTIVEDGIEEHRIAMAVPCSRENKKEQLIYIHSKLMAVDDKICHIGSANLNERSMGVDSECDVSILAKDEVTSRTIQNIVVDLLNEHTGMATQEIKAILNDKNRSVQEFFAPQEHGHIHLKKIICRKKLMLDDKNPIALLARKFGDKRPANIIYNIPTRPILIILTMLLLVVGSVLYLLDNYDGSLWPQEYSPEALLQYAQNSPWGPIIIIGIYLLAGLTLFPLSVLNVSAPILFGGMLGGFYAFIGSMTSAAVFYMVGYSTTRLFKDRFRNMIEKINYYAERGGIAGMTCVRLVPIAPFTVVNMAFGLAHIPFAHFMIASFLGMAPMIAIKAVLGDSIKAIWENPTPLSITYIIIALFMWGGLIWVSQKIFRRYKRKMAEAA